MSSRNVFSRCDDLVSKPGLEFIIQLMTSLEMQPMTSIAIDDFEILRMPLHHGL